jgi:MT0933-like antitoxin protein
MPDWEDEAKDLAGQHSDLVDKGLDEAGQQVDDKTGNKFDSQVQDAEKDAENSLGANQGQGN